MFGIPHSLGPEEEVGHKHGLGVVRVFLGFLDFFFNVSLVFKHLISEVCPPSMQGDEGSPEDFPVL